MTCFSYFEVLSSLSLLFRDEWYTNPANTPNGIPTPMLCIIIPKGKPIMIIPHKMQVLKDLFLCFFSLVFSSFSIVFYFIISLRNKIDKRTIYEMLYTLSIYSKSEVIARCNLHSSYAQSICNICKIATVFL